MDAYIQVCNAYNYAGARNQIKCVWLREVHYIRDRYTEEPPTPADVEFLWLARRVMIEHNMDLPKNTEEAIIIEY